MWCTWKHQQMLIITKKMKRVKSWPSREPSILASTALDAMLVRKIFAYFVLKSLIISARRVKKRRDLRLPENVVFAAVKSRELRETWTPPLKMFVESLNALKPWTRVAIKCTTVTILAVVLRVSRNACHASKKDASYSIIKMSPSLNKFLTETLQMTTVKSVTLLAWVRCPVLC